MEPNESNTRAELVSDIERLKFYQKAEEIERKGGYL